MSRGHRRDRVVGGGGVAGTGHDHLAGVESDTEHEARQQAEGPADRNRLPAEQAAANPRRALALAARGAAREELRIRESTAPPPSL